MSKKTRLNKMCPTAADVNVGTMLDKLRDAVNTICSMLDDDSVGGADYVDSVTTALGLADSGDYDLDAS